MDCSYGFRPGRSAHDALRAIAKCLHVGVFDREAFVRPDEGTAQGSALSPLLGNVYLHYALDQWFEREVKPRHVVLAAEATGGAG